MAASFPGALSTVLGLITAVNNMRFNLTDDVAVDAEEIEVESTTGAPDSGTIGINNEIKHYSSKTALKFIIDQHGYDGTTPAVHYKTAEQGEVYMGPHAAHHNLLVDEVVAIETSLGINLVNVVQITGAQSIAGVKTFDDIPIGAGLSGIKANEIIIMADGFKIDGSSCELVETEGTAAKVYCKHLAVAKTEWFDIPKFRVPDTYDGGDIVINVCFRSAGASKTHSLGIRVASVATGEAHNPDTAAAYQLYNKEASDADIGEIKIKSVTVTQANHLMVKGEIWHCKFVMEDDAGADADDVLIDWIVLEWNKS